MRNLNLDPSLIEDWTRIKFATENDVLSLSTQSNIFYLNSNIPLKSIR